MSESQEQSQQYVKSRLFLTKDNINQNISSTKSVIKKRTPQESFQHDKFFATAPKKSAYSRDQSLVGAKDDPITIVGSWVTVIGAIPGRHNEIVEYFSRFGSIDRVESTAGNWIYLEYSSFENAEMAVQSSKQEPLIIGNHYIVSCVKGKYRNAYLPKNEDPPTKVSFSTYKPAFPPQQQKSIVTKVLESLLGE